MKHNYLKKSTALFLIGSILLGACAHTGDNPRKPASSETESMRALAEAILQEEAAIKADYEKISALRELLVNAEHKNGVWGVVAVSSTAVGGVSLIITGISAIEAGQRGGTNKVVFKVSGAVLATAAVTVVGSLYKISLTDAEMEKLKQKISVVQSSLNSRLETISKLKAKLGPEFDDMTVNVDPQTQSPLVVPAKE